MAFWMCPACGRKVPGYAAACHCGVSRAAASQVPPQPAHVPGSGPVRFQAADVPRPVWLALGILVLALLFEPAEPNTIIPLLGEREPLPRPSASLTPGAPSPAPSSAEAPQPAPRRHGRRRPAASPTP
jgi:hypothetical protein